MTDRVPNEMPLDRLRQFARLDTAATAAALVMGCINYVFLLRSSWVLAIVAINAVAVAMMARSLEPLRRGAAADAVKWLVAGNWMMAITGAVLAGFSWPIQVVAAVLPVAVAVPYVTMRHYRLLLMGAVGVATASAYFGLFHDVSGISEQTSPQFARLILVVFAPTVALLVVHAAATNASALRHALAASLHANASLQANEILLEHQAMLVRSSRSRIVAAADTERRRIERDLHDGAQQRLVGLSLQLSLAAEQLDSHPTNARHTIANAQFEVLQTQLEIRRLVRGLLPPVLARHGLGAALRAALAGCPNPVRTDISAIPRLTQHSEAALYFMFTEALHNVSRHTPPTASVFVTLAIDDTEVALDVADTGPGFDTDGGHTGQGLVNMADRVGAVGGTLEIASERGAGTRVRARIPRAVAVPGLGADPGRAPGPGTNHRETSCPSVDV